MAFSTVIELDFTEAQRLADFGKEWADRFDREEPLFTFYRSTSDFNADEAGTFGGRFREVKHLILRSRMNPGYELSPELGHLPVEREAVHVGTEENERQAISDRVSLGAFACELNQGLVFVSWSKPGYTERQSACGFSGRSRKSTEVQQVHVISVVAEL